MPSDHLDQRGRAPFADEYCTLRPLFVEIRRRSRADRRGGLGDADMGEGGLLGRLNAPITAGLTQQRSLGAVRSFRDAVHNARMRCRTRAMRR